MNLHEYQAKELFARFGLPVLPGQVANTPEEARDVAASLGGTVVIKAQVLVGGRGKAGGVKLAQHARRGVCEGEGHPRPHHQGPAGAQGAGGAGRGDRQRALPRDRARSREEAAADHDLGRGWRRDRGSGEAFAREDRAPPHPARRLARLSGACAVPAAPQGRRPGFAGGRYPDEALACLPGR